MELSADVDGVSGAITAPSTPRVSTPQPQATPSSSAAPSPAVTRPHFHFRSALTSTPNSSSSATSQPSPFLHSNSTLGSNRRSSDDALLQRRRIKERKSRIQQTFLLLSSCSIVLLCLLLVYWNYLLLAPQLTSLFWAVLFSLLLSRPQQLLTASFESLDDKLRGKKTAIASYSAAAAALVIALSRANIVVSVVVAVLFVLVVAVLYGERQHLVSLLLLLVVVFLIAFPLAFFLKTCVDETQEISRRGRAFISNNPQFEHLLRNFTSSSYYSSLLAYAQHLGVSADTVHSYLDPASLKDRLSTFIASLSDQLSVVLSGALSVLAQLGNTLISLVSFLGFLYFLLDNRSAWLGGLLSLSPFSEEENARLGSEMRRSVQSIFICSFLIGLLHMVSTYIAFTLVGIDLCLILSFLAGFCAMLPVFSSWLVWGPAIVSLLCLNRPLSACLLLLIQLFLCLWLDPIVYGRIRPEQSSLIGMSIVFGLGAFGSTGVVLGPLLTTVTLTLGNMYVGYLSLPLAQHGRSSTSSGAGSGSESMRLSTPASKQDEQWTGESFPTYFHAAADTPAATLRPVVHFASTNRSAERAGARGYRTQPPQLPPPLEPPSPLSWQTNPLGSSNPPSTFSSALTSPAAATYSLQPTADDKKGGGELPLEEKRSDPTDRRLGSGGPVTGSHDPNRLVLHTAQPSSSPSPLSPTRDSATTDSASAVEVKTVSGQTPFNSNSAHVRPSALRPLRTKEEREEEDSLAVPSAVFIHESEDDGPDSASTWRRIRWMRSSGRGSRK